MMQQHSIYAYLCLAASLTSRAGSLRAEGEMSEMNLGADDLESNAEHASVEDLAMKLNNSMTYYKKGPAWNLQLYGVYCRNLDLGQYKELAETQKCLANAETSAEAKAKLNCFLCDVSIAGARRDDSMFGSDCHAEVTCSASRVPDIGQLQQVCSTLSGHVGRITYENAEFENRKRWPDYSCRPCPNECIKCEYERGWGTKDFKCVMQAKADKAVTYPDGYQCSEMTKRNCKSALLPHYNADCNRGHWKSYCKWLQDYPYGLAGQDNAPEKRSSTLTLRPSVPNLLEAPSSSLDLLKDADAVKPRPSGAYSVSFYGIKCESILVNPFPMLDTKYATCLEGARARGAHLVNDNCGLCDVTLTVNDRKRVGDACNFDVRCAAWMKPDDVCYKGHGKLGAIENLNKVAADYKRNKDRMCLPCPKECDIECTMIAPRVYKFDMTYRTPATAEAAATPGDYTCKISEKGETVEGKKTISAPEPPGCFDGILPEQRFKQPRTCSQNYIPAITGCKTSDFNAVCNFEDTYTNGAFPGQEHRDYEVTIESVPGNPTALSSAFDVLWDSLETFS